MPAEKFPAVKERLSEAYFEPVVIEDLEAYCVVKEQYTEHADILRDSVAKWERRGHLFFLMKDELSVMEALEQEAQRLAETDLCALAIETLQTHRRVDKVHPVDVWTRCTR